MDIPTKDRLYEALVVKAVQNDYAGRNMLIDLL